MPLAARILLVFATSLSLSSCTDRKAPPPVEQKPGIQDQEEMTRRAMSSLIYTWLEKYDPAQALANRVAVPEGYQRAEVMAGTFEDWLRHLPLKKGNPPVILYNGRQKQNQDVHAAVVDIDVGEKDLQQCADAVIRLRAEYLYSTGNHAAIQFKFTSGDDAEFSRWAEGYRPAVSGNKVTWSKKAEKDASHKSFRKYLDMVFTYAGSASLSKELHAVADVKDMKVGNVFIQGGFPGHAVIVVDMAAHKTTGKKIFLLAQSYMPAQDMHILKNPNNASLSPWYELDFGDTLRTPEWTFKAADLRKF